MDDFTVVMIFAVFCTLTILWLPCWATGLYPQSLFFVGCAAGEVAAMIFYQQVKEAQ